MDIQEFTSYSAAESAALACIERAITETGRATVLVSSFLRTEAIKEVLAKHGLGLGVKVETLNSWIDDLWELYGDGRACVDITTRALVVRRCLEFRANQITEPIYKASNGIAQLISEVLRTSTPAVLRASNETRDSLNAGEREVLEICEMCFADYANKGLVERSEMCARLKDMSVLADEHIILFDTPTTFAQDKLIESAAMVDAFYVRSYNDVVHEECEELTKLQQALFATDASEIVCPAGSVRFALPAGKYAENRTVFDELCATQHRLQAQSIAVASADPVVFFEALAKPLAEAGIAACVDGSISFAHTAFGAAWIKLMETVTSENSFDAAGLADFALSAFSYTSLHSTYKTDAYTRGYRGAKLEDALENYEGAAYEEHRDFMAAIAQENYEEALQLQSRSLAGRAAQSQNEYLALQRDAALFALDALRNSQGIGLSITSYIEYLKTISFVFRAESAYVGKDASAGVCEGTGAAGEGEGVGAATDNGTDVCEGTGRVGVAGAAVTGAAATGVAGESTDACEGAYSASAKAAAAAQTYPRVLFTKYNKLAECEPQSFDVVILADLSAEQFSFAEKETALDFFLQKIGTYKPPENIARLRKQFSACVATASKCLILERVLNDEKAAPSLQSALLEQLIDCYRPDATATNDLIRGWLVPKQMEQFVRSYGEKDAIENMLINKSNLPQCTTRELYATGHPKLEGVSRQCLLAGASPSPQKYVPVTFSASAIEAYKDCPFRWFVDRRIGTNALGTDFSAVEKGTFIHAVMKDFHETLARNGMVRVTPDNVNAACEIMAEIFDAQVQAYKEAPYNGALVALNQFEQLELRLLRRNALDFVRWEANLTPNFVPRYNEYAFGKEHPVKYAGVLLTGFIDRIDEDAQGNIIIYDYKSSASKGYAFFQDSKDRTFALPKKIQALVYAQVARRELGKNPVGALYIGYDSPKGAAGLYDPRYIKEEDVGGAFKSKNATVEFLEYLDLVEKEIANYLKDLFAGEIAPSPSDKDSCTFCSVQHCALCSEFQKVGKENE